MRPCARRSTSAGPASSEPTSPPRSSRPATCWQRPRRPARRSTSSPTTRALSWEGLKEPAEETRPEKHKPASRAARDPGERRPRAGAQRGAPDDPLNSPAPVAGAPFQATVEVRTPRRCPSRSTWSCRSTVPGRRSAPRSTFRPGGTLKHEFRFTLDRGGRPSRRGPACRGGRLAPGQPALLRGDRRSADPGGDRQASSRRGARRPTTPSTWSAPWPPADRSAGRSGSRP